jgi:hypothetical protein
MAQPHENHNGDSRTTGAPLLDETCGIIRDVLALTLSPSKTAELFRDRAANATTGQLLRAATQVLREQQEYNARLTARVDDLADDLARAEDQLNELGALRRANR